MAYVALYRQWRPQDFANLVGQDHISATLNNAITAGKIAHAYLFSGPRGTGKTSTAKIFAKALNCVNGPTPEPCNQCPNCLRITAGASMDVFEIDAASNRGIDEIRDLREAVKFAPVEGRYKVYIVDEVHMLTTEAFNALLKTLEEPPAHVVFILATTEAHKIPATIHSRCQRYDFRRIPVQEIEKRLADIAVKSGLSVDAEALRLIAVHADGGLRDALSILDQCATLDSIGITAEHVRKLLGLIGNEWVKRLTEALANRDAGSAFLVLDELVAMGKDVRQVLSELMRYWRSLMLTKAAPDIDVIRECGDDLASLMAHSEKFTHDELIKMIKILHDAANDAKWALEPRIIAEMALLSVCRRSSDTDISALAERIAALEARTAKNAVISSEETAIYSVSENNRTGTVSPNEEQDSFTNVTYTSVVGAPKPEPEPLIAQQVSGDIKSIWEAVLKELLTSGKRSVHACVAQGQLVALNEKQAIVQFTASFPKERTEKEDYRAIVEKILAQVSGKAVGLHCVIGTLEKSVSPVTAGGPSPAAAKEEAPAAVRQAQMMFGGKIIKQGQNEEV